MGNTQSCSKKALQNNYLMNPNINTSSYSFYQDNCAWNNDARQQPQIQLSFFFPFKHSASKSSCTAAERDCMMVYGCVQPRQLIWIFNSDKGLDKYSRILDKALWIHGYQQLSIRCLNIWKHKILQFEILCHYIYIIYYFNSITHNFKMYYFT